MADFGVGETIALISALTAATSTAYSVQQSKKQQKAAKEQQRQAALIQEEEKKEALEARKSLIDQQREVLQDGYKTRTKTPQASGLVGRLEDDILG